MFGGWWGERQRSFHVLFMTATYFSYLGAKCKIGKGILLAIEVCSSAILESKATSESPCVQEQTMKLTALSLQHQGQVHQGIRAGMDNSYKET